MLYTILFRSRSPTVLRLAQLTITVASNYHDLILDVAGNGGHCVPDWSNFGIN